MSAVLRAARLAPRVSLAAPSVSFASRGFHAGSASLDASSAPKLSSPIDADWTKMVQKELKGKDPMSLVWHTAEVRLAQGRGGDDDRDLL